MSVVEGLKGEGILKPPPCHLVTAAIPSGTTPDTASDPQTELQQLPAPKA